MMSSDHVTTPMEKTQAESPVGVVWQYVTLGGAPVVVMRHDDRARFSMNGRIDEDCTWKCRGCGGSSIGGVQAEGRAQREANQHAKECRACLVSEETKVGTAPSLVAEELAKTRAEVAQVAVAVRELNAAVTQVAEQISGLRTEAGQGLTALQHTLGDRLTELNGEVATEIAETAEAVRSTARPTRRRWWRWRR